MEAGKTAVPDWTIYQPRRMENTKHLTRRVEAYPALASAVLG